MLNQGCGAVRIFSDSDSTSLRIYDSNSDSRIPTKTTPTPASSKKRLDSDFITLNKSHFLKYEKKGKGDHFLNL